MYQLLYLLTDVGVLEMFLESSWILLGLLEDTVHYRILQDADDL